MQEPVWKRDQGDLCLGHLLKTGGKLADTPLVSAVPIIRPDLQPVLGSETRCWAGAEVLPLTAQLSSV